MNPVLVGMIGGVAFGSVAVMAMLPLSFPDKKRALLGAFLSRFAIGFLIPLCHLPLGAPVAGGLIGLLISAPDAVITKAYGPILGMGILGGAVIGWVTSGVVG